MDKVQIINKYLVILRRIISFYQDKCTDTNGTYKHIRRARIFIDADPKSATEVTGSKLFKYKEIIFAKRPDKISHNIDTETVETLNEHSTQKDIANDLINNILNVWRSMEADEKDILSDQLIAMLKLYIQYLLIEKSNQ